MSLKSEKINKKSGSWSHTRQPRKVGTYHGKGFMKFSNDEVDTVLNLHETGISYVNIVKHLDEIYGWTISRSTVDRIIKNPHKYRPGYIKPKDEYKNSDLILPTEQ